MDICHKCRELCLAGCCVLKSSALYLDIYRYEKGDPWIPYEGSPVEFRGVVCYVVGYFL